MSTKLVRRFVALSLPLLLAAAPLALVIRVGRAEPAASAYFVTKNGAGVTCAQSAPCPLQTALGLAGTGATIFVEQGTYTGGGTAVVTVNHSIKLIGGWSGNPVGFPLVDPALYPTTLDGQDSRRGLYVSSGLTPTIAGFIVSHGNATGLAVGCLADSAKGCGGGIFVDQAAADIENNTLISNTALVTATGSAVGYGGGLYLEAASGSVISHNVFLSNTASPNIAAVSGQGGGLEIHNCNINTVVVENNQFIGNVGAEWGGGMALEFNHNVQVQGNSFQGNVAISGGGLYTWYCSGSVLGNVFRGNTGDAPAYLGHFAGPFNANLLVDNPSVAGVVVAYGDGGLAIVSNNIAGHNGNLGIDAYGGVDDPLNLDVLYDTVVGPGTGTGLFVSGYVTTTAINTLISGFSTGITNAHPASATVNANYTLFDTDVISTGNAVFTHNVFGTAAFVNPAQRDYHILANSAARDAGTPVFLIGTDFDGDHRPIGPQVDIGADETSFIYAIFLPLTRR